MSLGLGIANELLETPLPVLADEGGLGTNLMIWYQNGVGVSTAGWVDSGPGGIDATQSTIVNRPAGIVDGGLRFDQSGSDSQWMDFQKITIGQGDPYTLIFAVLISGSGALQNRVILSDSGNEFLEIQNPTNFRLKYNNPSNLLTVLRCQDDVFLNGSKMIVALTRNSSGEHKWFINGEQIPQTGSTNATNDHGFDLQNLCIRNDNDRALDGNLYELALYSVELTTEQLTSVTNGLADKLGMSI